MGLTEEELMETMQGAIPKEVDEEYEAKRRQRIAMERGQIQQQPEEEGNGDDPIYMLEQILIGVQAIYNIVKENAERDKRIETKMTAFIYGEDRPKPQGKHFFTQKHHFTQQNFSPPQRGTTPVGTVIDTPVGQIVQKKPVKDENFEWK